MSGQHEDLMLVVFLDDYPALDGLKDATIKGNFSGRVTTNDDGRAIIQIEQLDVETENRADRELKKLKTGNHEDMELEKDDEENDDI